MNRTILAASVVLCAATLPAACSSGGQDHPGAPAELGEPADASKLDGGASGTVPDTGVEGTGDASAKGDGSGSGGTTDSGSAGTTDATAITDAAVRDGGPGDSGAFQPPPPQPNCAKNGTWLAGVALGVSTAGDDLLDAVTPDELSIAWTVVQGANKTVHYADRTATSAPFTARSLTSGLFTNDRVALSSSGLRLLVVDADGQGFSELTRASRSDAFDPSSPSAASYPNLNGSLGPGQAYGDPVLAADDAVFYYSVYGVGADGGPSGGGAAATIFRAARLLGGDVWPAGTPLSGSTGLFPQGSLRQRPTGLSSDQQTLFVWDEITGTERAAAIDSTGTFSSFEDLGARSLAAPSGDCTTLYYSAAGAGSIDLFVAKSN